MLCSLLTSESVMKPETAQTNAWTKDRAVFFKSLKQILQEVLRRRHVVTWEDVVICASGPNDLLVG